jgi:hypothetical protein
MNWVQGCGLLMVICLLLCAMGTPANAAPMRIIEGTYCPLSGNPYSISGLVNVQNGFYEYVELFMGFGLEVFVNGLDPIYPVSEIEFLNSDNLVFSSLWTEPFIDAYGRKLSVFGTIFFDAQVWGGQNDPPAYWPFASGLNYQSIDLSLEIQNPGYQPDEWDHIHLVAMAVPEPGTFLLFASGITLLVGYICFRRSNAKG